jgi:hypothetical protein
VTHEVPSNAVLYTTPDGQTFWAPPNANFSQVTQSGQSNGLNPFAGNQAIGQFGTYDYQRSGNQFITAYTDASNYAVGAYAKGAGLSMGELDFLGNLYALFNSSNFGSSALETWWNNGWQFTNSSHPIQGSGSTCQKQ